jgi:hypothetical protein
MYRKTFTYTVEYFKRSGKLYTSEEFELETAYTDVETPEGTIHQPYTPEAVEYIRRQRDQSDGRLPGLSGTWFGSILVRHEQGVPHLILPKHLETQRG